MEAIRPGFDINNYPTFTPDYVNMYQGFQTLRFMDWAGKKKKKKKKKELWVNTKSVNRNFVISQL